MAQHEPLDYGLLDEVDEGVQRLAIVPPSPKSKRIRDFEVLVNAQNEQFKRMVAEAQGLIAQARAETLRVARERDEARSAATRAPPGPPINLPPMPAPFTFGAFTQTSATFIPDPIPPPHHPPPFSPPTMGFGSLSHDTAPAGPSFLSARGSLMSHVKISRDMQHMKEQEEKKRRGTQLANDGHSCMDQELVDVQTVWLTVQEVLDDHFGVHGVPSNIQGAMDAGERQLTVARQSLRIIESHGPRLVAQF